MRTRLAAFTLVELLVVISIIAVLLSFLLPALADVKRRANQVQDLGNLQQHAQGVANYGSAHDGRMPTTPRGNDVTSGRGLYSGPRYWPALRFAGANGDGSGRGYDQGGDSGAWNGWAFNRGGLRYDDVWRAYNIAFGDWIADASGVRLLHDVFASAGSSVAENFGLIRSGGAPLTFPEDFPGTSSRPETPPQSAIIRPCSIDGGGTCFIQPSYRYTLTALYDKHLLFPRISFFQLDQTAIGVGGSPFESGKSPTADWSVYRAWVQQSDYRFASQKVVFWEFWAVHSRRASAYFQPHAKVAVSTLDGSARIVEPFEEMPSGVESADAADAGVGWGTRAEFEVSPHSTRIDIPGFGPFDKPYAWFAMTSGGPRGRDLGGR